MTERQWAQQQEQVLDMLRWDREILEERKETAPHLWTASNQAALEWVNEDIAQVEAGLKYPYYLEV